MKKTIINDLFLLNEAALLEPAEKSYFQAVSNQLHPPTRNCLQQASQSLFCALILSMAPRTKPRNLLRERVLAISDSIHPRVVTNKDGAILSISKPFSELCGYSFEEIRGKKPGSFLQGPETSFEAVVQFRRAIASRTPATIEILNYRKSGSRYWVRVHLRPVLSQSGSLEGFAALEEKIDPCKK